ncbi:acyl-CoA dehydrogenase [Nocardioidaceae bacterium]|nr:acyl-CoA dehydrogenase [Nocardioidaceae bacterium]
MPDHDTYPSPLTPPAIDLLRLARDDDDLPVPALAVWARSCRGGEDPVGTALSSLDQVAGDVDTGLRGPASRLRRWSVLAAIGAGDLTVARAVEPHLDARAILAEAEMSAGPPERRWGVYAAGGPGRLEVVDGPDGSVLTGTKSWASLAGRLQAALVTARDDDGADRLLAIELDAPGVHPEDAVWVPRGLELIDTPDLSLEDVAATPVGGADWYVRRPGFAAGGVGVAAVWFGAAVAIADALVRAAALRTPDQVAHLHIGACRVAIGNARSQLIWAAEALERALDQDGDEAAAVAYEVRSSVAAACEEVMTRVGHGLGPGPLVRDPEHARRVADLTVFLRQHHAERDLAALGALHLAGAHG